MKLHLFTRDIQQQWIETGYNFVKLTYSKDLSSENLGEHPFTLLEPYLNNDEALESDKVVPVSSPEIDKIIIEKTGMHYQ
ncbi:hypothetical protein [Rubrolithibacter danxiaensis]|uniref:hypothetical protein n=1 Tax=Rubrolithibacter danxiaensis TaxID=3390805 RepID=UPI003BF7C203